MGNGPGGYVCAIRAAQLGMKTACIDKRALPGGTCLNVGCIPSKALLHASHLYTELSSHAPKMGISAKPVLNLKAMMKFKEEGVKGNTEGVRFLLKKNKIEDIIGTASIPAVGKVEVASGEGKIRKLSAKHIIIATGSDIARLPNIEIDEKEILSSTGALSLAKVPKKMLIIGGGVIGLELGSVWQRLGAAVTVVEFLPHIAAGMDSELAKQFERILKKQGFAFKLSSKVSAVKKMKGGLQVLIEPASGKGKSEKVMTDVVLVAIGRVPYHAGLGLEALGVKLSKRGEIEVDGHFQSSVAGIYAIGDVITGPMLAHKAEDEGVALAEHLAGLPAHVNYDVIPSVVYTEPELASVGKTEEQLKGANIDYSIGKFPFTANGRAKVNGTTDGFVKILACAKSDRILGVHIIGTNAGELIAEACVAMEFGASAEDIARICHAHPTLSEAVKEAALAVDKRPIHM
ncbi:MAG: dihydrolipoyl dehydrogenase [Parvibaculales bacterium]